MKIGLPADASLTKWLFIAVAAVMVIATMIESADLLGWQSVLLYFGVPIATVVIVNFVARGIRCARG